MFHKHDWDLIDYKKLSSEVERLRNVGLKPNTHNSLKEKHVWIFKCKKCPKIKKFVEIN
jgi:hypothetical protein